MLFELFLFLDSYWHLLLTLAPFLLLINQVRGDLQNETLQLASELLIYKIIILFLFSGA